MAFRTSSLPALAIAVAALAVSLPVSAASPALGKVACGTSRSAREALFLHDQRMLRKPDFGPVAQSVPGAVRKVGEIAVIEATPDIVAPANPFDLSRKQITITPSGSTFAVESGTIDAGAAISTPGTVLDLEDDDFSRIELPFEFPFYGTNYSRLYVQSDGNVTFIYPEASSTARSFSRVAGGPPNISPFFRDLDPSRGGRVLLQLEGDRLMVTWDQVPVFVETGTGSPQTFQVSLDSTGGIEFRYGSIVATDAVVGLFPGDLATTARAVDWSAAGAMSFDSSDILAEVFRAERAIDEYAIVHAFYRSQEDAYDSLIVFNDLDLDASRFSLAHAYTVRNDILGIGEFLFDYGRFFGSPKRLSAFVNMGAVSSYPPSPFAAIPGLPHSSLLTILAHEVGHRFLAYAPLADPESGEFSSSLLGRQFAHWSFFFNSQASVLEGNAIRDHGAEVSPRFETVAATQTFSALDQYLMGLLDASEVPATFLVKDPTAERSLGSTARSPEVGVTFDGVRQEIRIEDIIAAAGERRPGLMASQKHFRHALALVVEDADSPDEDTIRLLERLRTSWLTFVRLHLESRATVDTELVRMLHLSTWPAGGLINQASGRARVSISEPRDTDLVVNLDLQDAIATVPSTVSIAAGDTYAEFELRGLESGFTNLVADTNEAGYDRSVTRLSVREDVEGLTIQQEPLRTEVYGLAGSSIPNPLYYRVIDENRVPYSGVEVEYVASGVDAPSLVSSVTDHDGEVSTQWLLAASPAQQLLTVRLKDAPESLAHTTARVVPGLPEFNAAGVFNAASQEAACAAVAAADQPVESALPDSSEVNQSDGGDADQPVESALPDSPSIVCAGQGFAPGSLVTIQGSNLSFAAESADTLLVFGNPALPYLLGGTRVHVEGIAAPVVEVAPGAVTFQVPFQVQGLSMRVLVVTPYGRSTAVTLPASAAQPGIFPDRVRSGAEGAVVGSTPGSNLVPEAGGVLELSGTGLGAVSPTGRTGRPGLAQPPQQVVAEMTAWVDDQEAEVTFSGLSEFEAGVYVVRLDLPSELEPGDHSVRIAVGGTESNTVPFKSQ